MSCHFFGLSFSLAVQPPLSGFSPMSLCDLLYDMHMVIWVHLYFNKARIPLLGFDEGLYVFILGYVLPNIARTHSSVLVLPQGIFGLMFTQIDIFELSWYVNYIQ